jgi:hypothetical protein
MINRLAILYSSLYPRFKNDLTQSLLKDKNEDKSSCKDYCKSSNYAECYKECTYINKSYNNLKLQNEYLKSELKFFKEQHKYCEVAQNISKI